MDFSKLDPNVAALIISAASSLAVWIYNKARGRKTESISDMVRGLVDQGLHLAIVKVDSDPARVYDTVSRYVWAILDERKIPRNTATNLIVGAAINLGIGEALKLARENDRIANRAAEKAFADLAVAATTVGASMDANLATLAAADAKLAASPNVEILEPNRDGPWSK